jgi:hypothetical protein
MSLFLACQHLISETNLDECEDQSWSKVEVAPYDVSAYPQGYEFLRLDTTVMQVTFDGTRCNGRLTLS